VASCAVDGDEDKWKKIKVKSKKIKVKSFVVSTNVGINIFVHVVDW